MVQQPGESAEEFRRRHVTMRPPLTPEELGTRSEIEQGIGHYVSLRDDS